MKKRGWTKWAGILGVFFLTFVFLGLFEKPVDAQKPFLKKIRKNYELERSIGKCALCHDLKEDEDPDEKNINILGKAIKEHELFKTVKGKEVDGETEYSDEELETVLKIFKSLENEDTDKDGATNIEELKASTFPADPKSTPTADQLKAIRK